MSDPTSLRPGNEAPADPAAPASTAARAVVAVAAGTTVDPFDRSEYAGATSKGYGDAMGRGLELALTVLVFGGIGLWIDHVAGTSPIFAIAVHALRKLFHGLWAHVARKFVAGASR